MSTKPKLISCKHCRAEFAPGDDDVSFYEKLQLPWPTWCPDCRLMRRLAHCNEGVLYPGQCNLCGKRVVSQYAPGHTWPVYCVDCWWSDKWSGSSYGRTLDFSRPLLAQFRELELSVPHACVSTDLTNENSEYTHHAGQERDCYFIFHATFCESCFYGYGVKKCRDCVDVHNCFESELCYECVDVDRCYSLFWSQDCQNCSTSYFLRDCIGCTNCFLSIGLRNKEYCFANEQLSREAYEARLKLIDLKSRSTIEELQAKLRQLELQHPFRALKTTNTEASFGNYLINAKSSQYCFDCRDVEHCNYCTQLQLGSRHCQDIYQFGNNMELCYEGAMIGSNAYNVHFSSLCIWQVNNLSYCIDCYASSDCFLSFGLRHSKFCILNKSYPEDEYRRLRDLAIAAMKKDGTYGEFFPVEYSQFGYNETTAQRWFPLSREQVIDRGWRWQENLPGTFGRETKVTIPDSTATVDVSICQEVLCCQTCQKNFKIIEPEFQFYQRCEIPLPEHCFECRRATRSQKRNRRQFWERHCERCGEKTLATYSPSQPEIVYCVNCYQQTIY